MNNGHWSRGDYFISTDATLLDVERIHAFLTRSYWAAGIPLETVQRSIAHSLCFGVFQAGSPPRQVGFARVISDRATFAYLADVFIADDHRGQGLSKWLMEVILAHPELQRLRRWLLATADAHELYAKFDFKPLARPERFMERHFPDVYNAGASGVGPPRRT